MLGTLTLEELLAAGRRMLASDLHLAALEKPRFRCDGLLQTIDDTILSEQDFSEIVKRLFGDDASTIEHDSDAAIEHPKYGRLRLHAYRSLGVRKLSIRFLAEHIADPRELGLPSALVDLFERDQVSHGLILIAGATGQGKTTALASLLEQINAKRSVHIVTIEDPIEYRLQSKRAHISQRELGRDVYSFAAGIRAAMRMDLDVLSIGELRDADTISAALRAAETGHLVFATVHGTDAIAAIERIIDAFDEGKSAIRAALAASLRAVLALRLIPRTNRSGRVLASELLIANESVRALVREQKTHHLRNAMLTGRAAGMHTFETSFRQLLAQGDIDMRAALLASAHPDELQAA